MRLRSNNHEETSEKQISVDVSVCALMFLEDLSSPNQKSYFVKYYHICSALVTDIVWS